MLSGSMPVGKITLNVDGKSWTFEAVQTQHGRGFLIEEDRVVKATADAKRLISFGANDWHRQLGPGHLLSRFYEECRARRKADPEAAKWFDSANMKYARS